MHPTEVTRIIKAIESFKLKENTRKMALESMGVDGAVFDRRTTLEGHVRVLRLNATLLRIGPPDYGILVQDFGNGVYRINGTEYHNTLES